MLVSYWLEASVHPLTRELAALQATITRLQDSLDFKSMAIGVLSKINRHGGSIESRVQAAACARVNTMAIDQEIGALVKMLCATQHSKVARMLGSLGEA